MKRLLGLLVFLSAAAFAQNARYDSIAIGPLGPIPFATVAVCTQPTNTTTPPCTPLASLCSSLTDLTCASPNPLQADLLGNFHFYAKPSSAPFTVQIYGPQVATPYLLPDQLLISSTGSGTINPCGGNNCDTYYPLANTPSVSGDQSATDDGAGNKQAKSYRFTDPNHSGFWNEDAGPALPALADLHAMYFSINPAFGTTYGLEPWDNIPTNGDCVSTVTGDAAGWAKLHDTGNPCGVGSLPTQTLSTPSAPTLTNQNAAGARSITYLVVGCQDGPTCAYHSPASVTTNIANANASPQVLVSGYGDTLYGYRCYNIYVTSDSGGRTTGLVANCVWKQYLDTASAGDTTTAPSTNTTQVWATPLPSPGCNIAMGQVTGIDAPPCTPNADDWEGTETNGIANAANPYWIALNPGAVTTSLSLSGGYAIIDAQNASADKLTCLQHKLPAGITPPYSYVAAFYVEGTGTSGVGLVDFGFYESSSSKVVTVDEYTNAQVKVLKWTSPTALVGAIVGGTGNSGFIYVKLQNSGGNAIYYTSPDGIHYVQLVSHTLTTDFTTAPDSVVVCADPESTEVGEAIDYVRRVQ